MADEKQLNEDELFTFVEYSPEAAERIGYSDYSYWKSVFSPDGCQPIFIF